MADNMISQWVTRSPHNSLFNKLSSFSSHFKRSKTKILQGKSKSSLLGHLPQLTFKMTQKATGKHWLLCSRPKKRATHVIVQSSWYFAAVHCWQVQWLPSKDKPFRYVKWGMALILRLSWKTLELETERKQNYCYDFGPKKVSYCVSFLAPFCHF